MSRSSLYYKNYFALIYGFGFRLVHGWMCRCWFLYRSPQVTQALIPTKCEKCFILLTFNFLLLLVCKKPNQLISQIHIYSPLFAFGIAFCFSFLLEISNLCLFSGAVNEEYFHIQIFSSWKRKVSNSMAFCYKSKEFWGPHDWCAFGKGCFFFVYCF